MPTTISPAAAILGAPKRSLKNSVPIAAPTMIDDSRSAAIRGERGPRLGPEHQAVRDHRQGRAEQAPYHERA